MKVRVSGPFTVESLSPHRSLAFAGSVGVDGYIIAEDGFASVAAERRLGRVPVLMGADERRPGDGGGAEEDRRRQPVHGLR